MHSSVFVGRGSAVVGALAVALLLGGCIHEVTPDRPAPTARPAPGPTRAPAPAPTPRSGEFRPGIHMTAAIARVLGGAVAAEQKTNLGFDRGVTFMGAFLRPQSSINWRIKMQAGARYAFFGGGDDGAIDVDISVYNSLGQLLARDQVANAKPIVGFTAMETGAYVVRITLARATRSSFCALAILRNGGFTVPVSHLTSSLKKIMAAGRLASRRASVRFHEEKNQWALFGAVLKPGDTTTISGVKLEGGRHMFVAAGDANITQLDMSLLDQNGNLVKKDLRPDAVAVFLANTISGTYKLAVTNSRSAGPSLVSVVILDVL
jgi:hypothetical protein